MKDLVKSILDIINKICTTDSNEGMNIIYDKDDMDYLLEKCKLLEYTLDNQYFTNLVSDLETNIEYNTESIYIYNILTSLIKSGNAKLLAFLDACEYSFAQDFFGRVLRQVQLEEARVRLGQSFVWVIRLIPDHLELLHAVVAAHCFEAFHGHFA